MRNLRVPVSYRWRRVAASLPIVVILLLVVLVTDDRLRDNTLDLVRPGWFYVNGLTRYDFQPTPEERDCLDGTARRVNAPGMPHTIPKVVHFITGVDRPNPVTLMFWLAVRAAAVNLPGYEIRLHYVYPSEEGPWWTSTRRLVTLVRHEAGFLDNFTHVSPPPSAWHPAHKADVLRLQILLREGGVYLDTDAIVLRPLDKLLRGLRDIVLAHEGGHRKGMTNAVILAKPGAPFLQRWYRMYSSGFNPRAWNHHSVILPAKLADANPGEVCQLSPGAFFWPLWPQHHVDWMHRRLSRDESQAVAAAVRRNNGSLIEEQLVYHAWNHPAQRWMDGLTLDRIRSEDTRFNLLVRRVVDAGI